MPENYGEQQYVKVDVEEFWKKESLTFQNWDISDYRLTEVVRGKLEEINKKIDDLYDVGYADFKWEKDLTDEQKQTLMPEIEHMVKDLNAQISYLSTQYYDTSKDNKDEIIANVNSRLEIDLGNFSESPKTTSWEEIYAKDLKENLGDLWWAIDQRNASILKEALGK